MAVVGPVRRGRLVKASTQVQPASALDVVEWYHGKGWVDEVTEQEIDKPDIIEFSSSDRFLDRPNIYPRQGTMLKIIFLQDELFTEYDHQVIGEWIETFQRTGHEGIQPDIYERIRINKARGRPWFREVVSVIGRRGGKGHIGAVAGAYVLWNYLALGDPQGHFGVDRDKRLTAITFAGKKEQAQANQWKDLSDVIRGGPCFAPYISKAQGQRLTVYAPHDFARLHSLWRRGIELETDIATFEIIPSASTLQAGRGPTSFMQHYDEMAHVVATGANRDAEAVYCLDPGTRVLGADLVWKTLDDVQVGDRLVAVDEFSDGRLGSPRKLREATVLGRWETRGEAYKVSFEDGSSVVCSGNHRWLRSKDCKNNRWATIEAPVVLRDGLGGNWASLRVGDYIRQVVEPWEVDESREGGYLAGVFDGEGHVRFSARGSMQIGFAQNPGTVLDRVRDLLAAYGFNYKDREHSPNDRCEHLAIRGLDECWRFLGTFQPHRLLENARDLWQGRAFRASYRRIASIEKLPEQRLIDIETSERTFIAEGLVSHNSAATPSLDQFKEWGFIYEGSSPWQMTGQFYTNWERSLEKNDDGSPAYPEMLMLQLPSWSPYQDWEQAQQIHRRPARLAKIEEIEAPEIESISNEMEITIRVIERMERPEEVPTYPPMRGAMQELDEDMLQLERANPDTFRVERRSQWATVLDAYLNSDHVKAIFADWGAHRFSLGLMETKGVLGEFYKAHGDPSKSGAGFGFAIAHTVIDPETGLKHVVFDVLHQWNPADFPAIEVDGREMHQIDYLQIEEELKDYITDFMPFELTFDQFNSVSPIAHLTKHVRDSRLPKQTSVYEKTATAPLNWKRFETFKTAINMGLVHGPYFEIAELELRFLQDKGGKVDHPDSGPVQTKDVADCMAECVYTLIGTQMQEIMDSLSSLRLGTSLPGGMVNTGTAGSNPYSDQFSQSAAGVSRGAESGRGRPSVGRPESGRPPGAGINRRRPR